MPITKEDVKDFSRFAEQMVEESAVQSLIELAAEWEAVRCAPSNNASLKADSITVLGKAFPDVNSPQQLQESLRRTGGITTQQLLDKAMAAAEKAQQG
jgi:hypothetical protein